MTKQILYDSSGEKSGWYKYEYDTAGNMTKRIQYYENGETIYEAQEYITIALE